MSQHRSSHFIFILGQYFQCWQFNEEHKNIISSVWVYVYLHFKMKNKVIIWPLMLYQLSKTQKEVGEVESTGMPDKNVTKCHEVRA